MLINDDNLVFSVTFEESGNTYNYYRDNNEDKLIWFGPSGMNKEYLSDDLKFENEEHFVKFCFELEQPPLYQITVRNYDDLDLMIKQFEDLLKEMKEYRENNVN